jgi:predicted  nucleic acid-binding Zn-ribbon protein
MADRELPPIRVRIVADSKKFDKAIKDVEDKAKRLQDSIDKVASQKASANAVKMAVKNSVDLIERGLKQAAQSLVGQIHTIQIKHKGVTDSIKNATKAIEKSLVDAVNEAAKKFATPSVSKAANAVKMAMQRNPRFGCYI